MQNFMLLSLMQVDGGSHKGMDDQMTLSKFQSIFLQTPSYRTMIYHSKTWGGFPEIRSIFSTNHTHLPWW